MFQLEQLAVLSMHFIPQNHLSKIESGRFSIPGLRNGFSNKAEN